VEFVTCSRHSVSSGKSARRTSGTGKKARGLARERVLPSPDSFVLALALFPFVSPPETEGLEEATEVAFSLDNE